MKNRSDQPFALVGVHVGGSDVKQLHAIMEKENLPWRSFADAGNAGAGPIAKAWNLDVTPTLYLIDDEGVIRCKWAGVPGEAVIDASLERWIEVAQEHRRGARK